MNFQFFEIETLCTPAKMSPSIIIIALIATHIK